MQYSHGEIKLIKFNKIKLNIYIKIVLTQITFGPFIINKYKKPNILISN